MANSHNGTLTKVNGGELTETILCLMVVADALDLTVRSVVSKLQGITPGVVSKVGSPVGEVNVLLDVRAVQCFREVELVLALSVDSQRVKAPKTVDTFEKVEQVLSLLDLTSRKVSEVRTTGGSKDSKDDCQLIFDSGEVEFISLKNGGWGQYRQQGCTKESFESVYKFIMPGFNFDEYWLNGGKEIEKICKTPAIRFSSARGDYSTELRGLLQSLLVSVQDLHKEIEPLLQTRYARRCLARGLVSLALGEDADAITYLDVARPDLGPVKIVREDAVDILFNSLRDFTVTFDKDLKVVPDQNSFTTTLWAGSMPVLTILTTGSTNRCAKGLWSDCSEFSGVSPRDIRSVKPQSPFALSDDILKMIKS